MAAGGDFTDPVTYQQGWLVLAAVLPVLVIAWYAGATWLTREKVDRAPRGRGIARAKRTHLKRLDRVEAAVRRDEMSLREAHQEISAIVRSFVTAVGAIDARSMTLAQLRQSEVSAVADVVELVYPPEFQPGQQGGPNERLAPALRDARAVITGWGS